MKVIVVSRAYYVDCQTDKDAIDSVCGQGPSPVRVLQGPINVLEMVSNPEQRWAHLTAPKEKWHDVSFQPLPFKEWPNKKDK